ncbi:AarF/ABC1/UbiB kinase family protein [Hoyosella sp. G463]|uniref:AarF/ABC1/UbiB kinase family protein n=1 Tax=Lolliginicoccus lacisalsi TaxID=2742202 RepID=A0A927JCC5_9ACTN|nr:AarF/ABC1/UbiB kinase family protein [Lolliginicoccus lacisalsi]
MSEIPRSGAARSARLASLPLGYAGRAAAGWGRRLSGQDGAQVSADMSAKAAEQLFAVLGELKGGAMKIGQALSVFEAAVPEELAGPYRDALTRLQRDAPPLSSRQVHRVLDEQLGRRWRERFTDFQDLPAASASIGQVHRATWHDGREVAVKVQYPGADEALRSDLRQIRRLAPLMRPFAPGVDVRALVDELTDRTIEELDYRLEADNQRAFAEAYAASAGVRVPRVVASSPKVMVSEWMDGVPLARVSAQGSEAERAHAAGLLADFVLSSPGTAGMLHVDAHPGNFMIRPDGRLGVLDFGAVIRTSGGFPPELVRLIKLGLASDFRGLIDALIDAGYLRAERGPDPADLAGFLDPMLNMLRDEMFDFTRDWMRGMSGLYADWRSNEFRTARAFAMPAQYMMIHRVLVSTVAILCQLEASVPMGAIMRHRVPELAGPA